MSESLLSGRFGEPEGGRLLSQKEKAALENLIRNEVILNQIIVNEQTGGGGDAVGDDAIVAADGTLVDGTSDIASSARTSGAPVGSYDVVVTTPATQLYPVASCDYTAGDGGSGVNAIRAFDDFDVEATDDSTAANSDLKFYHSTVTDTLYVLGDGDDLVYKHPITGFVGGTTTVNPNSDEVEEPQDSGIMSREKTYVWLSASNSPSCTLRAIRLSDDAVFDFGSGGSSLPAVAAYNDGINERVLLVDGGQLKEYLPNFGTLALGAAVKVWNFNPSAAWTSEGTWTLDGHLWFDPQGSMYAIDPAVATIFRSYQYTPAAVVYSDSPLCYDTLRNRFYLAAGAAAPPQVWMYGGFNYTTDHSGVFTILTALPASVLATGLHHDPESDILFIATNQLRVIRYHVGSNQILDTVTIDDQTPDISPPDGIDYDLRINRQCYYADNYGYVIVRKSSTNYMCRVSYNGDPLEIGDGGEIATGVLVALTHAVDSTTVRIKTYRSLSPAILADSRFTVHIGRR